MKSRIEACDLRQLGMPLGHRPDQGYRLRHVLRVDRNECIELSHELRRDRCGFPVVNSAVYHAMRRHLRSHGLIGTADKLEQGLERGAVVGEGLLTVDQPGPIRSDYLEPTIGTADATRLQTEQASLTRAHGVHCGLETGGASVDRENPTSLRLAHT